MSDDKVLVPLKLVKSILANALDGFVSKTDADSLRDLLAQPSDGALTNEPVAVVDESDDGIFIELIYGEDGNPLRLGDKLYRHPPKVCTCPSGDGSLRWPCPVHPSEVKVVLPERKRDSCEDSDVFDDAYAEGWNACLDRVKELNS